MSKSGKIEQSGARISTLGKTDGYILEENPYSKHSVLRVYGLLQVKRSLTRSIPQHFKWEGA